MEEKTSIAKKTLSKTSAVAVKKSFLSLYDKEASGLGKAFFVVSSPGGVGVGGKKERKERRKEFIFEKKERKGGEGKKMGDMGNTKKRFTCISSCAGVESDLPEDITERCVLCFEAAVANHMNVGDAIKKVQNEPLKEIDEKFKGQRWVAS